MIEAEGNTRLLVAHVRRIRFPLDARARAAPGGTTRHSVILDEITTLDLALTELLSVGKPDALGSRTLAR
jgi:hypothetical protein